MVVNCVRNLFLMVFSQLDTTILVDLPLSAAQLLPQWSGIFLKEHFDFYSPAFSRNICVIDNIEPDLVKKYRRKKV